MGGYSARYEIAGRGEPVVLVHGLSGSTRWWSRNIPDLAERYSVYLLDLLAEDVRADLQRIGAPTLLIWGENDTLVPLAAGSVLREEIPDSRLLVPKWGGARLARPPDVSKREYP